ncbi:RCC1/BLIP-II [Auriscalpium vulgare]|uniref:RCC1/BLIP-II n=1 Tax=Auriscalpium vulgare TaxID=40419 RepID=A0ACB8S8A7_9AGAM|nr:RCC1/BLIP-II [Auriscalpium vulgare]
MSSAADLCLFAAGSNGKGQLATGHLDDVHTFQPCSFSGCPVGGLPPRTTSILTVVGGGNHTLVLLSRRSNALGGTENELWGCGDGARGQLGPEYAAEAGDGTAIFRPVRLPLKLAGYIVKMVAACWETSYLVLSKESSNDVVVSMGGDDYGDLGVDGMNKKDKSLPFHIVDLSGVVGTCSVHLTVKDIAAGPHHVVVLLQTEHTDGSTAEHVAGWGSSRHGQLGPLISATMGRLPPFVSSPAAVVVPGSSSDPIRTMRLGNQHSVFLHASGRLSALGSDRKGQTHGLSGVTNVASIGCTWNGTYALAVEDSQVAIYSVGSHARGQLGRRQTVEGTPSPVEFPFPQASGALRRLACGSEHVLSLITRRDRAGAEQTEVWGWGWNEHGNLGVGSLEDVHVPVQMWPSEFPVAVGEVIGIWAGCGTSWIVVRRCKDRPGEDS